MIKRWLGQASCQKNGNFNPSKYYAGNHPEIYQMSRTSPGWTSPGSITQSANWSSKIHRVCFTWESTSDANDGDECRQIHF
jgi:hypothetical protein